MDEGAYATAAEAFRRAAKQAPDDPERWIDLGEAEILAGEAGRAREAFERAAALRPRDQAPRVRIGFTWEMERRYDDAQRSYKQAIEIAPERAYGHRVMGSRLLAWGRASEAVAPLVRALELDAGHGETWNALALAYYHKGDRASAERTFREGLEAQGDHMDLWVGLAGLLVNAGRYEEALDVYDGLVGRWPRFAPAHVGRALLLHELGRPDEAEAAFLRAAQVADDPGPYQQRLLEYRMLRLQGGAVDGTR
jgi:tetratricopeptide (TPR) repeat protein